MEGVCEDWLKSKSNWRVGIKYLFITKTITRQKPPHPQHTQWLRVIMVSDIARLPDCHEDRRDNYPLNNETSVLVTVRRKLVPASVNVFTMFSGRRRGGVGGAKYSNFVIIIFTTSTEQWALRGNNNLDFKIYCSDIYSSDIAWPPTANLIVLCLWQCDTWLLHRLRMSLATHSYAQLSRDWLAVHTVQPC